MPQSFKILGQIVPTNNTFTNVYVTGASASAIVSAIYICNQGTANANVDIIVRPINETLGNRHFVCKDSVVYGVDTEFISLPITMGPNTILAANVKYRTGDAATPGTHSINAFGVEVT